jgi:4-hydroxybenzoate-CoA ligase
MTDNGNAALYFVDRHLAEGRADKLAFREAGHDGRAVRYGDLAEVSGRVAGALERAGIARESRALMLS